MHHIQTYYHTQTHQRVYCSTCDRVAVSPLNPKWIFPCDITYKCSICRNVDTIHYPESCYQVVVINLLKQAIKNGSIKYVDKNEIYELINGNYELIVPKL